jgi:RNA-directed DNA polymerase
MEETRKIITQQSLITAGKVIASSGQGQSVTMSEARERRLVKRSMYAQERTLSQAMMEEIISHQNLLRSYRRVVSNAGSAGIDGMQTKELKMWLRANYTNLREQLMSGMYRPQGVKGVEIPKPGGGKRQLGIPTVADRFVQQSIAQVMMRQYEPTFSEHSYGFRPNRHCHQALQEATKVVSEGRNYVIDLDLEKFFDEVSHDRLMSRLSKRIGDNRVLKLIRLFLQSGIMQGGVICQRIKGTPQGSPLSPLLSNIVLDELDQEMESRGLKFVRYADDVKIFAGSEKAAQRIKENITRYIEGKLLLKVNQQKSRICKGYELNFLGHCLLYDNQVGLSKESEARLKAKVKTITERNRGISFTQVVREVNQVLRGWHGYFRYAAMQTKIQRIDGWIKRRLRCFRIKQCKRVIGIVRFLRKEKIEEKLSWKTALSGKGWWRLSNSPATNMAMNDFWFAKEGYYSLSANYKRLKLCETAVCVKACTVV